MTETKFTPGPWFISKKFVVGPRDQEDGQSYGMIVGVADVYGENRSADANLIAASPMLYRYLAEVRKWMDTEEFGPWEAAFCAEIDAVLAKARGEA